MISTLEKSPEVCQFQLPAKASRNRRPKRRMLFFPAHPEQRIEGNGKKYFLHLLTPEALKARGMSDKRARFGDCGLSGYSCSVMNGLRSCFAPNAAATAGAM